MMEASLVPVMAGFFGLVVGSFLNVCTLRWPQDESIVSPGSRCPKCLKSVQWYDNVPILSWIILRARCRFCSEPISVMNAFVLEKPSQDSERVARKGTRTDEIARPSSPVGLP